MDFCMQRWLPRSSFPLALTHVLASCTSARTVRSSLRARDSEERGPCRRARERIQRHSQRFGPVRHHPPNQPNISSTRWRTVADHGRKLYFFESALTPSTFWVDLNHIDFSAKTGKVKKLDLGEQQRNTFAGDTVSQFQESKPFRFLGPPPSSPSALK
jgi:penicillin V acylase-like amidase (Ntn superfamily)